MGNSNIPVFSIIIPTYNAATQIGRAVTSVLQQTFQSYELIVVDDGSTDETREVLKSYLETDRVHYIYQTNKGVSSARNAGIEVACGEYVAFLDSDDYWDPGKLDIFFQYISSHQKVGLFYSDVCVIDEAGRVLWVNHRFRYSGDVYYRLIEGDFITTSSAVVRKEYLDKVGYFSTAYQSKAGCEDWDLWLRLAREYHVRHIPNRLTFYSRKSSGRDHIYFQDYKYLLEKFVTNDKNLPKEVQRKAFANYFYVRGKEALLDRNYRNARQWFKKCVVRYPWTPKYYLFYCASSFNHLIPQKAKEVLKIE